MQLRIWYSEDLQNSSEADNDGESCADVYVMFDWSNLGILELNKVFPPAFFPEKKLVVPFFPEIKTLHPLYTLFFNKKPFYKKLVLDMPKC